MMWVPAIKAIAILDDLPKDTKGRVLLYLHLDKWVHMCLYSMCRLQNWFSFGCVQYPALLQALVQPVRCIAGQRVF